MAKRPPCPGNPEDYIWVASKEKPHWRRKRGRVTAAILNACYQASADMTKVVSPAAKRIRHALARYLGNIQTGRLNNRICNAFRKSLKERGSLQLSYLRSLEMQRDHRLDAMLVCGYRMFSNGKKIRIEIPIEGNSIKPFNRLVTHYYFEAVLLYGDAGKERALQTEEVTSALYPIEVETKDQCVLELELPVAEDWCVLLKTSCIEGNEMAAHTKHYRMKVIGAYDDCKAPTVQ